MRRGRGGAARTRAASAPTRSRRRYVCAAFLCHFSETLRAKTSEDVHLFLTDLPTAHWGTDEVETLLSEAYILSTLFKQSPAHLQHEPDGITATGGFL